ncbi:MAG TPA: hypothetical protein VFU32_09820 [Ktedonobacterales bacterium]|nr:hypothetical protein [Ktedonobacterales bacterium]
MEIIVAYFHPLLNPDTVARDFDEISLAGAHAVLCALHEQDVQRWPKDLERGFSLAHEMGLKLYVSLSRHGGIFSGPQLIPSWYPFRHPQTRLVDQHGHSYDQCCVNQETFRNWLFREVHRYLSEYPIDGVLLDEPQNTSITCFCSHCHALCPDIMDRQRFHRQSIVSFLSDLCALIKHSGPASNGQPRKTMLLAPMNDLRLLDDCASIPTLDSIGLAPTWQHPRVDLDQIQQAIDSLQDLAQLSDKQRQLWVQNYCLLNDQQPYLDSAFEAAGKGQPDQLGCFYFWRNNEAPEAVWRQTRAALRRFSGRQLRWPIVTQPLPRIRRDNLYI